MKKACKGPPWNEFLHVGTSGNISAQAQEYSLEGMGKTALFKSQDKHTAICQGGAKSISEALGLERNIGYTGMYCLGVYSSVLTGVKIFVKSHSFY